MFQSRTRRRVATIVIVQTQIVQSGARSMVVVVRVIVGELTLGLIIIYVFGERRFFPQGSVHALVAPIGLWMIGMAAPSV